MIDKKLYVYIVLGAASGEWRNWVEGIFTDKEKAYKFFNEIEGDDGGWNSYHILEGAVDDEWWVTRLRNE